MSQKNVNPSLRKETESRISDSRQEKKYALGEQIVSHRKTYQNSKKNRKSWCTKM